MILPHIGGSLCSHVTFLAEVIILTQNIKVKVNKRSGAAPGPSLAWMYLAEVIILQKTYAVVVQYSAYSHSLR